MSWNRLFVGVTVGSILLALTACGSNDDTPKTGDRELSAAQQECVDKANQYLEVRGLLPDTLPEELPPLSKAPEEGLTITQVFPGSVPTGVEHSGHIVDIAPLIGWTGKAVTYDGSLEDLNRKALEAISNSDVVLLEAELAAVQEPIRAAKEQGVLLMLGSGTEPPESIPGFGAAPRGGELFNKVGELAAYALMQATNCQGKVAAFGIPFEAMRNLAGTMGEVLERECEDCSYSYADLAMKDIGSPAATNAVVSKLQSDPLIDFAFFTIGDLAVGLEPALKQAGLDVKVGGALPTPINLTALKKGTNSFWLGMPTEMGAWLVIDTALRALDSGHPTVGDHYPVSVLTTDNIVSTEPIPVYPTDFKDRFKKLWHVD